MASTLSQSERHTLTSQVLNQLIRDGVVGEQKRPEGYRKVRRVLVVSGATTREALREAVNHSITTKGTR
jgi:DNA-binding FadR family transcriptional regulator